MRERGGLGDGGPVSWGFARLRRTGFPLEVVGADDCIAHAPSLDSAAGGGASDSSDGRRTLGDMLPPIENRDPGDETTDDD